MFSLNRPTGPIQSLRRDVRVSSVCVSVPSRKTRFPENWRLLVEEYIANIGMPLNVFSFLLFWWFSVFWNFWTGVWCVAVAVAVSVSDKCQVTGDMRHVIPDTWHMTHDTWHMTHDIWDLTHEPWIKKNHFCLFLSLLVSMLLSANVARFSVSHMRNCFLCFLK